MIESKRNLIFVPELSATTFLFFYYEGNRNSRSYSVRDYSQPGFIPPVRYAKEFPYTAGEILDLSARAGNHRFPAPKRRTDDLSFWHAEVLKLNQRCLNGVAPRAAPTPLIANLTELRPLFPMLNVEQLNRHAKAKKRGDLQRIFTSPSSEDYATWNIFQLLRKRRPEHWWSQFITLAERKVPGIAAELDSDDVPEVKLWDTVACPTAYERASRARMRQSGNPDTVQQSHQTDPVEGASEIDITLKGRTYLIYIEAKLHHDISTRTTHDAERDQISRNIDCLLENCGDRRPFFWMIVRDEGPRWLYTQRLDLLRKGTSEFLPHRPREITRLIARRTALFLWREVLEIATRDLHQDEITASVNTELRKRFGLTPNLLRPDDSTAVLTLEDDHGRKEAENVSAEIVSNAISSPKDDHAVVIEPSAPPIGTKKCACGCGLPVMKNAYVWGHKSRSRINTIPMIAKDLAGSAAVPDEYHGSVPPYHAVAMQKTPTHLAISHMYDQIVEFEQKIGKLKEAIEILRR